MAPSAAERRSTASSAKSATSLLSSLNSNGLPNSLTAEAFAKELYKKVPRKVTASAALNLSLKAQANQDEARRKADKERAEMQRMRFSLVIEDDAVASTSSSTESKGKGREKKVKGDKGKSRRKQDTAGGWESDEEERSAKRRKEDERYAREDNNQPLLEIEEDPAAKRERERLEDAKERDEFSARMKDRELEKTRNKNVVKESMDPESVARRALQKDPEALGEVMPDLRLRSRQSYLNKRESQQLDLLRIEIADDERDFKGMKLTKRERSELDRKKELLRLAEERLAVDEGFDGYVIPEGMSSLPCFCDAC